QDLRAESKIYERNPRFTSGIQDLRAESKIYERNPRFTSGIQDLRARHSIHTLLSNPHKKAPVTAGAFSS
ncbi:hypothetical protein, partial [Fictibacillus barbaricus]